MSYSFSPGSPLTEFENPRRGDLNFFFLQLEILPCHCLYKTASSAFTENIHLPHYQIICLTIKSS